MKMLLIVSIGLLSCFMGNIGYADDSWQRSFYWSGAPWGFGLGACFVIPLILMVAFWAAVIVGIIYFLKWITGGKRRDTKSEETALDILKKRYARGELTKEDFEKMKHDIQ